MNYLLTFLIFASMLFGVEFRPAFGQTAEPEEASTSTESVPFPEPRAVESLQATVTQDTATGVWIASVSGTYGERGSTVNAVRASIIGVDEQGDVIGSAPVTADLSQINATPFTASLIIPLPDISWSGISLELTVLDSNGGEHTLRSVPFPLINRKLVLINHAIGGSFVDAPNYITGGLPAGIGIPHRLINTLPEGEYAAVLFFKGLTGCPSAFTAINSFRENRDWGYDILGPQGAYSKASTSSGGGCIQAFHIDPNRGDDWLWGAIDVTATSSAIADSNHIPAFAICATIAACDPIVPTAELTQSPAPRGVSNVLFLPGIKSSSLYEANPLCFGVVSTLCDLPLWLPLADASAPELFMDESGKSKRQVYTRSDGVFAHTYGYSFYDALFNSFETRKSNSSNVAGWNWKTFAYDWRRSLPDIVGNGNARSERITFDTPTTSPYLVDTLRTLASSSPTRKVTLIAHSNGGLVAKELLRTLGDAEASHLVDALVLVGVPQSGAPQALSSLLFGTGEGIPGTGLFPEALMSRAHARSFALNAPMTYHLLPSSRYFDSITGSPHPLITFGDEARFSAQRNSYGSFIDTEQPFQEFARATAHDRSAPAPADLAHPSVLNDHLLQYSEAEHADLDSWQPPAGIEIYQIGGFNTETLSGIAFEESTTTIHGITTTTPSYRPLFTPDGDGVVPITSALLMNASEHVHQYWIDLAAFSTKEHHYDHGTLLEIPAVIKLINRILDGTPPLSLLTPVARADELPGISITPPHTAVRKELLITIHSLADISVQKDDGAFLTTSQTNPSESTILGSVSGILGNDQYIVVPAQGTYVVKVGPVSEESVGINVQTLEDGMATGLAQNGMVQTNQGDVVTSTISSAAHFLSEPTIVVAKAVPLAEQHLIVRSTVSSNPHSLDVAEVPEERERGTTTPTFTHYISVPIQDSLAPHITHQSTTAADTSRAENSSNTERKSSATPPHSWWKEVLICCESFFEKLRQYIETIMLDL